jgi:hypothetical protein
MTCKERFIMPAQLLGHKDFTQNKILEPGEPGICNALVLRWLAADGGWERRMENKDSALVKAAKELKKNIKVADPEQWKKVDLNLEDIQNGKVITHYECHVNTIQTSPRTHWFLAFSNTQREIYHAMGMITRSPSQYEFFDPNEAWWSYYDDFTYFEAKKLVWGTIFEGYEDFDILAFTCYFALSKRLPGLPAPLPASPQSVPAPLPVPPQSTLAPPISPPPAPPPPTTTTPPKPLPKPGRPPHTPPQPVPNPLPTSPQSALAQRHTPPQWTSARPTPTPKPTS